VHAIIFHWFMPFFEGLLLGVVAMLLHEAAHIFTAIGLGIEVKQVGIKWNKGLFTVRDTGTVSKNLLIALAGPMMNMILILSWHWSARFSLANFCYALANLLPIEGSDGWRIANCWMQLRKKDLMT
jgi:hypothetical protein